MRTSSVWDQYPKFGLRVRTHDTAIVDVDLATCRRATNVATGRGSSAVRSGACDWTVSGGQAVKGIRWMPWHQEAMKDVAKLR